MHKLKEIEVYLNRRFVWLRKKYKCYFLYPEQNVEKAIIISYIYSHKITYTVKTNISTELMLV